MFDAPVSPYAAGHYHRRLSIVGAVSPTPSVRRMPITAPAALDPADQLEDQRDPWDAAFSLQLSERGGSGGTLAPAADVHRAKSPVPSINLFSPSDPNGPSPVASRKLFVPDDAPVQPRWKTVLRQVIHTLFPSLVDIPTRPWLWKIVAVCSAPAIFALTLTLPVVVNDLEPSGVAARPTTPLLVEYAESDAEEELVQAQIEAEEHVHDVHFNKWLTAVQCAFSPVFCIAVLFGELLRTHADQFADPQSITAGQKHVAWYVLAAALCGVSVSVLTAVFANDGKSPAARLARSFIGFGVGMVWIMAIADEVVQVLQVRAVRSAYAC
jgi:sodium/potassium/calcium exchanger 6